MKPIHSIRAIWWALALSIFIQPLCHAWDRHQSLMSQIVDMNPNREYLKEVLVVPSVEEQKKEIALIVKMLDVNGEKIPLHTPGKMTVAEFLKSETIDEPDQGMDQDLPDSVDPAGDRAWMGGKTGPTSQGFRHMVFPGIEWASPMSTIQIPTRSIGQAPERILKLQQIARKYFAEKKRYWGLRITLWELHLIQDLHQPFHVMQVPAFGMLPLKSLFSGFVARSTQVISNFHYAYEGLILETVMDGSASKLASCFEESPGNAVTVDAASVQSTVQFARKQAHAVGEPLLNLWEAELKDPETNLPMGVGTPDYYAYLNASEEEEEQKPKIKAVQSLLDSTCVLMKQLTQVTLSELDQALK